jgi:hypothetical protein
MATGKNAICKKVLFENSTSWYLWCKFFVSRIVSYSVLFLLSTCETYWQGGWTLSKPGVNCLLYPPVWVSTAFWVALHQNENFQKAIVKELRFKPKFFMSNGAQSLFSQNPHFEMVAYVLKSK